MTMTVLLLTEADAARRFEISLASMGLRVEAAPPLQHRQIPQAAEKIAESLNSNRDSGLVVTSARAANAFKMAVDKMDARTPDIIYAIGSSTAKSLPKLAQSRCLGMETGNADALADYIISQSPGPLLFPCSNLAGDTLPRKLEAAGITVTRLPVYTTGPNPNLHKDLLRLKQNCSIPSAVVFFSPSGVEYTVPVLQDLGFDFDVAKLIAIGPSTEGQIVKSGLKCWATAAEPTPQGVAALFENYN